MFAFSRMTLVLLPLAMLLGIAASDQWYYDCNQEMIETSRNGSQLVYDLSAIVYNHVEFTAGAFRYNMTVCSSALYGCGDCGYTGICRSGGFRSTICVGRYSGVITSSNGTFVTLVYNNDYLGALNNTNIMIMCDPMGGASLTFVKSYSVGLNLTVVFRSRVGCAKRYSGVTPAYPPSNYYLNCSYSNDCYSCLSNPSCVYCVDTNVCADYSMPPCNNYFRKPSYCSKVNACASTRDCYSCTSQGSMNGCYWCPDQYSSYNGSCVTSSSYCDDGRITDPRYCLNKKRDIDSP